MPSGSASADEAGARPQTLTPSGAVMERALLAVSRALIDAEHELDALDARRAVSPFCELSSRNKLLRCRLAVIVRQKLSRDLGGALELQLWEGCEAALFAKLFSSAHLS